MLEIQTTYLTQYLSMELTNGIEGKFLGTLKQSLSHWGLVNTTGLEEHKLKIRMCPKYKLKLQKNRRLV